jgi:ubiquinone/menaquinone biosynthesis C-methylase UbiE
MRSTATMEQPVGIDEQILMQSVFHASEAWQRWRPTLEAWLGPATDLLLDLCGIRAGSHVLDVAAGLSARSLSDDVSANVLHFAQAEARRAGLENVVARTLNGHGLDVDGGSFQAAIARGLAGVADRRQALSSVHEALGEGGRVGTIAYAGAARNEFLSIPTSIVRRRVGLPPLRPGEPGPFSLGEPGALENALEQAGFRDVETRLVAAPVRFSSAAEGLRFAHESFGSLNQLLDVLDEREHRSAWREVEDALRQFESPDDGFEGPCWLVVAAASK